MFRKYQVGDLILCTSQMFQEKSVGVIIAIPNPGRYLVYFGMNNEWNFSVWTKDYMGLISEAG